MLLSGSIIVGFRFCSLSLACLYLWHVLLLRATSSLHSLVDSVSEEADYGEHRGQLVTTYACQ